MSLIFSCYITDRTVTVLICIFTSISFQWVHLYYRNGEGQSFCSNLQIQNGQPPWNFSRFYFFHQIQKKYSIESNILKMRRVEAQQALSVYSREVNDHEFLEQNSLSLDNSTELDSCTLQQAVCPSKTTARLWDINISANSTFQSSPILTPICSMTQDSVSFDFQRGQ